MSGRSLVSMQEVFGEVVRRLEAGGIDYMIVGSIASIVYGEPRLTKDMDLVIDVPAAVLKTVAALFPAESFYCPPYEILADEMLRCGQFNVIHPESGLKIDFVFRKDTPHSTSEFARRRRIELWPGLEAFLASPEDVILKKLEYFREGGSQKHLLDIRGILAQTEVDAAYLESWVTRLGLSQEWAAAR